MLCPRLLSHHGDPRLSGSPHSFDLLSNDCDTTSTPTTPSHPIVQDTVAPLRGPASPRQHQPHQDGAPASTTIPSTFADGETAPAFPGQSSGARAMEDPIGAKMHIEVQVALNFVISYLYNKLPRRRVNIFGEELERALKDKFRGHWYPEKPFRGSAYRCLKTGDPIDPVLERAARESGVPVQDILENLPHELAVWVDPGEVSYRIGEKGAVKILFSDKHDLSDDHLADREVTKTFNPEAQCFRPIEVLQQQQQQQQHVVHAPHGGHPLAPHGAHAGHPHAPHGGPHGAPHGAPLGAHAGHAVPGLVLPPASHPSSPFEQLSVGAIGQPVSTSSASAPLPGQNGVLASPSSAPSPIPYKGSPSPVTPFLPRSSAPLTFTTATFAQTKFGSTKLKTNSKRANRMSPTEFSNYIKQRAMQQQQQQQQQMHHHGAGVGPVGHHHMQPASQLSPQGNSGRSLSPNILTDPGSFFFQPTQYQQQQHYGPPGVSPRGMYDSNSFLDMYNSSKGYSSWDHPSSYYSGSSGYGSGAPTPGPVGSAGSGGSGLSSAASGSSNGGSHSPGVIGGGLSSSASALGGGSGLGGVVGSGAGGNQSQSQADKQLMDSFNNFGLGPHSSSNQYQHLLVAN